MKKYNLKANKHNIPNLKLYTQLAGVFYGTLGLNFLCCFLYGRYVLTLEGSGLILINSILMFILTPIVMTDERRENRDLSATIAYGVMHGVCTIGNILWLNFTALLIIYGAEILVVLLLIFLNYRGRHGKGLKNSR